MGLTPTSYGSRRALGSSATRPCLTAAVDDGIVLHD